LALAQELAYRKLKIHPRENSATNVAISHGADQVSLLVEYERDALGRLIDALHDLSHGAFR
jgi:hypothetical protein